MSRITRQFTASALLLFPERRVLLLDHQKLGVWLYPGGHVEADETPDEAAIREVHEETGLHVVLLGECDHRLSDVAAGVTSLVIPYAMLCERIANADPPHDHVDLIYLATVAGDPSATTVPQGVRLVGVSDLADLRLFPNFRTLLDKVFADDAIWSVAQTVWTTRSCGGPMIGALP